MLRPRFVAEGADGSTQCCPLSRQARARREEVGWGCAEKLGSQRARARVVWGIACDLRWFWDWTWRSMRRWSRHLSFGCVTDDKCEARRRQAPHVLLRWSRPRNRAKSPRACLRHHSMVRSACRPPPHVCRESQRTRIGSLAVPLKPPQSRRAPICLPCRDSLYLLIDNP